MMLRMRPLRRLASSAVAVARGRGLSTLPTRPLGDTGIEVTEISLGGAGYGAVTENQIYGGVPTETAIACIHQAIQRGVNFFDVAPLYAEGEIRLGLVLKDLSPAERARLVISTKVGDECPPYSDNGGHDALSADGVLASFENSLKVWRPGSHALARLCAPCCLALAPGRSPGAASGVHAHPLSRSDS